MRLAQCFMVVCVCLLVLPAIGFTASEGVLFFADFAGEDPLEQEPANWIVRNVPDNAVYEFRPQAGYVSFDGSGGGFIFQLEMGAPRYLYWDRDLDATYTVETLVRFDRVNRFQSLNLRLQAFNVGYSVKFGEYDDDYNVSLLRKAAWDAPDVVVAHDGNRSPLFNDGSIVAAYKEQWIPVRIVLQGSSINVYVNNEHVLSYEDEEPIIRFSYGWYGFVAAFSVDQVTVTQEN